MNKFVGKVHPTFYDLLSQPDLGGEICRGKEECGDWRRGLASKALSLHCVIRETDLLFMYAEYG
jgi:hypothetical protein